MTRVTHVPINGPTLRWARESMFMGSDELARAAGTSEARIEAFETGSAMPTLRQLRLIGKKLDRTLVFFFTTPPAESDVPSAVDCRGHGGDPVPPLLAREMRRAEQYREAVLELEGSIGAPSLVGHIDGRNIEVRAREMRGLLRLSDDFVPESKRGKQPLANRTSGLCSLEEGRNEEALANAFAVNFLMPEAGVAGLVSDAVQDSWDMAEAVAENFKVSALAAGIRLKTLGLIANVDLENIRINRG